MEPGRKANGYQTLMDGERRLAWVDQGKAELAESDGLGVMKLYTQGEPIYWKKVAELSDGGWGVKGASNFIDSEAIVYLPEYEDQAKLAYEELRRRGGWWTVTDPESDIYLARLMGYGEEYIVPYIRKYHQDFDVESYIEENPRNKVIR